MLQEAPETIKNRGEFGYAGLGVLLLAILVVKLLSNILFFIKILLLGLFTFLLNGGLKLTILEIKLWNVNV